MVAQFSTGILAHFSISIYRLGDFGAKKIKEKSDFLSKLDIEKEQGVRITRQLTSNRALQKALENPEVKNAIMDVIESSIEEILANQKKVEL